MTKKYVAAVMLLITVFAFTQLAIIAFIALIFIAAKIFFPRKHVLESSVWIYISFFCSVTVLAFIFWFFNIPLYPAFLLITFLAICWAKLFFAAHEKLDNKTGSNSFLRLGALTGILVSSFVVLPLLLNPSSENVVRYSAKTSDDINHIARMEAIREKSGLLYGTSKVKDQYINPGMSVAPQAWHLNGAFIESLIIKSLGEDNLLNRLISYLTYKVMWIYIAVLLLFVLFRSLLKDWLNFKINKNVEYLGAVVILSLALAFLVSSYGYGFQNFIAAIALINILLIAAFKLRQRNANKRRYLTLMLVLSGIIINVWTVGGGVAALIFVGMLAYSYKFRFISLTLKHLLLPAAAALIIFLLPLLIILSKRELSTLTIGGATPPLNLLLSLAVVAALIIVFWRTRNVYGWLVPYLLTLLAAPFVLLATYQFLSVGEIRYYGLKLGYLTFITLLLFLAAYLLQFSKVSTNLLYSAAYLGVLLLIILAVGLDPRKSAYPIKDSSPITKPTARILLSTPPDNKDLVINTNNEEESYLATKLWSDALLTTDRERADLLDKLNAEISR